MGWRRFKIWFKIKFWWLFPKEKTSRIIKLFRQHKIRWVPTESDERELLEQFWNFGSHTIHKDDAVDALTMLFKDSEWHNNGMNRSEKGGE